MSTPHKWHYLVTRDFDCKWSARDPETRTSEVTGPVSAWFSPCRQALKHRRSAPTEGPKHLRAGVRRGQCRARHDAYDPSIRVCRARGTTLSSGVHSPQRRRGSDCGFHQHRPRGDDCRRSFPDRLPLPRGGGISRPRREVRIHRAKGALVGDPPRSKAGAEGASTITQGARHLAGPAGATVRDMRWRPRGSNHHVGSAGPTQVTASSSSGTSGTRGTSTSNATPRSRAGAQSPGRRCV